MEFDTSADPTPDGKRRFAAAVTDPDVRVTFTGHAGEGTTGYDRGGSWDGE